MPWQGSQPFPYDPVYVLTNAPPQSGVYVIYTPNGPNAYFGEAVNIRSRLLQHLNGDNDCITRSGATHFAWELVPAQSRVARQNTLILELGSDCNQKLG